MTGEHARLSEVMQDRRLELGMKTWRALALEADIAYETLRALRQGENVSPATAHALEKALRWEHGSIDAILSGGDPAELLHRSGSATIGGRVELTGEGHRGPPDRPGERPAPRKSQAERYHDEEISAIRQLGEEMLERLRRLEENRPTDEDEGTVAG